MKTFVITSILLVTMCAFPEEAHSSNAAPLSAEQAKRLYIGPGGNRLPFQTDEDVAEFLRSAQMQYVKTLTSGSTKPKLLLLEKDGIRAHAIFHYRHVVDRGVKLRGGKFFNYFRDSYRNQVAAYRLGRLLGISNIPPAVQRSVNRVPGSLQLWIENGMTERDRLLAGKPLPNQEAAILSSHDMYVFDNLINNIDRNQTNMLYDAEWQLWYIDHTRAFGREKKLYRPEKIARCSHRLLQKLQSLDKNQLAETLKPHIGNREIASMMARRELLLELLKQRIEVKGENAVLFHYLNDAEE